MSGGDDEFTKANVLHKASEHRKLMLPTFMVVGLVAFERLVETLKGECPEAVNGAKVADLIKYMDHPVEIGLYVLLVNLSWVSNGK